LSRKFVAPIVVLLALVTAGCKTSPKGSDGRDLPAPSTPESAHQGLLSDGPFEGEITLRLSTGKDKGDALYRVKDARIRMDLPGDAEAAAIVFDGKTNSGAILRRDGSLLSPISSASLRNREAAPAIVKTGTSETVAGFLCEKWMLREGDKSREACVVDNVAWASGAAQFASWLPKGAFPLRVVESDAKGVELSRLEVVKIERKSIPDAIFATTKPAK
jgi:hypothetical protein